MCCAVVSLRLARNCSHGAMCMSHVVDCDRLAAIYLAAISLKLESVHPNESILLIMTPTELSSISMPSPPPLNGFAITIHFNCVGRQLKCRRLRRPQLSCRQRKLLLAMTMTTDDGRWTSMRRICPPLKCHQAAIGPPGTAHCLSGAQFGPQTNRTNHLRVVVTALVGLASPLHYLAMQSYANMRGTPSIVYSLYTDARCGIP